jgi:anti-sigma B factor antagonist
MEKLIISEERVHSPVAITLLSLKGSIETTNASALEEAIDQILASRCYRIVVDLSGVTYISSAGWGIFISEIKRVRRNAGDIKLASMTAPVREVFDLLEFNNILKPYHSKTEAIRDFGSVTRARSEQK